jgi:hypothetical protein
MVDLGMIIYKSLKISLCELSIILGNDPPFQKYRS